MDYKKIHNSIQERIALDSFKRKIMRSSRNKKVTLIITSALALFFAGVLTNHFMANNEDE